MVAGASLVDSAVREADVTTRSDRSPSRPASSGSEEGRAASPAGSAPASGGAAGGSAKAGLAPRQPRIATASREQTRAEEERFARLPIEGSETIELRPNREAPPGTRPSRRGEVAAPR